MDEKKVREALEKAKEIYNSETSSVIKLLEEALAPAPRLYIGQPGWFSNGLEKKLGILTWVEKGNYFDERREAWPVFKSDPDALSIINWVEYDGGLLEINHANEDIAWTPDRNYYAIIPYPEFIGE
jgi:hypothetical protein